MARSAGSMCQCRMAWWRCGGSASGRRFRFPRPSMLTHRIPAGPHERWRVFNLWGAGDMLALFTSDILAVTFWAGRTWWAGLHATHSRRGASKPQGGACLAAPALLSCGSMAATLPNNSTPAAPFPPAVPPRPLDRSDINAELTKLLQHGHGSLLVKIHDHRVASLETLMRFIRGARASNGDEPADEA